jgi:hypothetical protein
MNTPTAGETPLAVSSPPTLTLVETFTAGPWFGSGECQERRWSNNAPAVVQYPPDEHSGVCRWVLNSPLGHVLKSDRALTPAAARSAGDEALAAYCADPLVHATGGRRP